MILKSLTSGIILIILLSSYIPLISSQSNTSNNSIQELIDNANSGDTIYISSGIYYEHIVVDKPLIIVGDGAETTIVDGMNEDEHIFNIVSDDVDISGFTIMNCSIGFSGVRVNNDSCNIHNNIFKMCGGGVELWDAKEIVIHNNTMEDNTWGIYVHSSVNCSINDNIISNNFYGIELGYSTVEIKNNILDNNHLYGVIQLWSNDCFIGGNIFSNHSNVGLQFYSSKSNSIHQNILGDNYKGINLDGSNNNTVNHNNISNNRYGIYYWFKSDNNIIYDNIIATNFYGITLGQSSNNNITLNQIKNNIQSGLNIGFSSNNTIINRNDILDNVQNGIFLHSYSDNGEIVGNNIIGNLYGIQTSYSSNNYINNNNISNNDLLGIGLRFSSNNKIIGNYVSKNDLSGIYLQDVCKYNIIKCNNIIDSNFSSFFKFSYPNFWINNYWDDWDKNTPRPIYGEIRLERLNDRVVPWIQFDWRPATEPYDI